MIKRLMYYWGIDFLKWDHDYSSGFSVKFGCIVRGQARLEIAWVTHKKEYRGW